VVRRMRSPGALREPVSYFPARGAGRWITWRATRRGRRRSRRPSFAERWTRLVPPACPGSGKGVVDFRPEREGRRDPLRNSNSVGLGRSRGCAWRVGQTRGWVLSNDAERLCAPGERANAASCLPFMMAESEAQGCRKCAAAAIGGYLGYTGRSADAFGTAARDP
jgi:hypothetical protein